MRFFHGVRYENSEIIIIFFYHDAVGNGFMIKIFHFHFPGCGRDGLSPDFLLLVTVQILGIRFWSWF